jgi:hypothetical protein
MTHLLPTHFSLRGLALLQDGARWVRQGGHVDFTADQVADTLSHSIAGRSVTSPIVMESCPVVG